jgi:hypothetical protein
MSEPTKKCCTCHRDNRAEHIRNVAARNAAVAERNRGLMIAYLQDHPCVDCGETDLRVLDFDHREPAQKRQLVTKLVRWATNWHTVLQEIAKCDVRCANCHRIRTASMSAWVRDAVQAEVVAAVHASALARLQALVSMRLPRPSVAERVAPGVWLTPAGG